MKKLRSTSIATHLYPEQVIDAFDGFAIEVCLRDDSRNTAFHLRYRSYMATEIAPPNDEQLFYDEYDFQPNGRIHLIWHEGKPVATIRSSVYSDAYDWLPTECFSYFPWDLRTKLPPPTRILESSRFAVDPDFQGRQSLFAQILLFRVHGLNAGAHGCSHIMTAVRSRHTTFYLRFYGMELFSNQSNYVERFKSEVELLANDCETCLEKILRKEMPEYGPADIKHYARCAKLPSALLQAAA